MMVNPLHSRMCTPQSVAVIVNHGHTRHKPPIAMETHPNYNPELHIQGCLRVTSINQYEPTSTTINH